MEDDAPSLIKPGRTAIWLKALYGVLAVAAVIALAVGYLAVQFRSGPVDITWFISRFYPISIERSLLSGPPAGRLTATHFSVGWRSKAHGLPAGIGVWADGLKITGRNGEILVAARHVYMRLLPRYLLHKRFRPVAIVADHGFVKLRLFRDGDLDLDWPDARRHMYPIPPFSLRLLHDLKVDHVSVSVLHSASGKSLKLKEARGALSRQYTGHYTLSWEGALQGMAASGPHNFGRIEVSARRLSDGSIWKSVIPMQSLAALQSLLPSTRSWHLPATLSGEVTLQTHGPAMMVLPDSRVNLTRLDGKITLGAGRIKQSDGADLMVDRGVASVAVTPQTFSEKKGEESRAGVSGHDLARDAARILLTQLLLQMRGDDGKLYDVSAQGHLNLDHSMAPKKINGEIHVALPGPVSIPQLISIWPSQLIHPVRTWVAQNLTQGRAQGLQVSAELASLAGFNKIDIADLHGEWHVRDAKLHWRRPIPPGIHLDADLTIAHKDALDIAFRRGWQTSRAQSAGKTASKKGGAPLTLKAGDMRIKGLFGPSQEADLNLNLSGDLSGFINILSEPELKLLKGRKLIFTDPSGQVDAQAEMHFPLDSDASPDAFRANVKATFRQVRLRNLVLGQTVSEASGHLMASQSHMAIDAQGAFGPLPSSVRVNLYFAPEKASDLAESFEAHAIITPRDLGRIFPDAADWFSGQARLTAHYTATEDGHAALHTFLDLRGAAIAVPLWRKMIGRKAVATALVHFRNRVVTALPQIAIRGDDIGVSGWGQTDHGKISILTLNKIRLAGSSGTGRVVFPAHHGTPIDARLALTTLDITPWLKKPYQTGSQIPKRDTDKATHASRDASLWQSSLRARDVIYHGRAIYRDLQVTSAGVGPRIRRGTLYAGGVSPLSAELTPYGQRARLKIRVQNLGGSLENLAIYDRLEGGHLAFEGVTEGDCCETLPHMRGKLSVSAFNFRKPPRLLQTLAHAALVDWSKTNTQRFALDRLHAKLMIEPSLISIEDGYFGNRALGATLRGGVDLRRQKLDLQGTVIPAFGFNAILGRFPNIGHLFSPEKEGGVFAATYVIRGNFKDPHVEANPFSVFLPGVIRSFNE